MGTDATPRKRSLSDDPCRCRTPMPDTEADGDVLPCRVCGDVIRPIPCSDRLRCKARRRWSVEAGTFFGAHVISQSCDKHLGDTVAFASLIAQPVRVVGSPASEEARQALRDAFDPTGELAARAAARAAS